MHRLTVLLAVLCLVGTASAVPMGTGSLTVEVQGDFTNNVSCARAYGFANQTYDVFGANVNLSSDLGDMTCYGETANPPAHCESYPMSSIFAFDYTGTVICVDPPGCGQFSFVTDAAFNVTGSLPNSIASDVSYTADGQMSLVGPQPSTSIPNCPLVGQVIRLTGTAGFNAFQAEATPTGTDQTVSFPDTTFFNPLTGQEVPIDIGITFEQVTAAGTTSVTASSNVAGEIPSNFALSANGFQAAFLDITTTATILPPIEICSSYDDAENDGFIDGTSPAVPEVALSFLHGEGEPTEFVDRTSSRDTVSNVICATVDSLSPFAILVRTNGTCAAPNDPCDDGDACTENDACNASLECVGGNAVTCPDDGNVCTAEVCVAPAGCTSVPAPAVGCNTSNGKSILLVRNNLDDDTKDQVLFKWLKGSSPLGDFGDPTATTDYTLCAYDDNKLLVSTEVPAAATCGTNACWSFTGPPATPKGVKYNDPARANDGVKLVKGKGDTTGKASLLFKALGTEVPSIDLAAIVYPITVQVRADDAGCWEQQFAEGDAKKNDGTLFKAVHVGP